MLTLEIPGTGNLRIEHLVLDYNGTLAVDGALIPGVRDRLTELASKLQIHVVTADTFGAAQRELTGLPCDIRILSPGAENHQKRAHVSALGAETVAAIGNGANDQAMLETAALAIAVVQAEGAHAQTVSSADVVCTDILAALDLFFHPRRLIATLRR